MIKKGILSIVSIALALAFAGAAAAKDEGGRPCKADVQKFCKDVKPGGGRIIACLKEHESDLSPECKAAGAKAKDKMSEAKEACKGDLDKYCKGVQPGQGRLVKCLADNKDKLSGSCKGVIENAEKKHPCFEDVEALCKGVEPGQGRIVKCLKEHKDQVSDACKQKVAERKGRKGGKGEDQGGDEKGGK
jgi:hypothetical protein